MTATTVSKRSVVLPIISADKALEAFKGFQELKSSILTAGSDVIGIKDNQYICKSGWLKLATVFNLSVEIIEREFHTDGERRTIIYRHRATAPNGRFFESEGSCSNYEKWAKGKSLSACIGMAQTRSVNRAIAGLIAPTEVSFEEMKYGDTEEHDSDDRPNFTKFMRQVTQMGWSLDKVKADLKRDYGKELHKCSAKELSQYLGQGEVKQEVVF